jgi:lipopolysaccharide/colanic/teichoic acid biosynthesis glycosyltransferase
MDLLAKIVFIASTAIFTYHHFLYPLLLRWLARRAGPGAATRADIAAGTLADADLARVTVIVPAYNEAAMIAQKIQNLAALDYPRDRLEVRVVLDGCSDETEEVARAALAREGDPDFISLQVHSKNRGKLDVLNSEIAAARGDVVVLSDVSARIATDALLKGSRYFADDTVGVVCGTYALEKPGSAGEAKYWSYQTRVKADEAAVGAPMGAHGAFYMFRRAAWRALPAGTINDDFLLPMRIVADGYRALYDEKIVAFEMERTSSPQEFARRIRIGAGNLQQLIWLKGLLNPFRKAPRAGPIAFVFGSGKALRPLIPPVVFAGALACLYLAFAGYGVFASIAISGFLVSLAGAYSIWRKGRGVIKPVAWLGYLIEGHMASLIGSVRYITKSPRLAWSHGETESERRHYTPWLTRAAKRAFDVVFSVAAILLLWPLFLPIAIAIRLETPGPIFYRQTRVGRSWHDRTELFDLIKFRTMYEDAEARSGAMWATKNDPRITRVGLFLRKTRLDELPQFINVIQGDMSLIGPRPERPKFIGNLESQLPFYVERTYGLRPGITGLAQINQGYDETIDDVRRKLLFDHAYAAHLTSPLRWLWMDLKIIFGTIAVMVTGRGQ